MIRDLVDCGLCLIGGLVLIMLFVPDGMKRLLGLLVSALR